jgi:predicted ATPase
VTIPCKCHGQHERKRIVLTGGPGAGKTAVLSLVHQFVCKHVVVLPEAASMLFLGGFPRGGTLGQRAATQRAIFHVQRELENSADAADHAAIVLCDRGTVDGAAYWPGPDSLWTSVGSTREAELGHYDAVIHLRTPDAAAYNKSNVVRTESVAEAAQIDVRIAEAWQGHPKRFVIESEEDFFHKARKALQVLLDQVPPCCRSF